MSNPWKAMAVRAASELVVFISFALLGKQGHDLRFGQLLVLLFVAIVGFRLLFVPRYPKDYLLLAALRSPKKGETIRAEVEGK